MRDRAGRAMRAMPSQRRWLYRIAAGLLLVAILEIVSLSGIAFLRQRGVIFSTLKGDYVSYLANREPILGWPSRIPDAHRDRSGARVSPSHPDRIRTPPQLSVYGDSYTYSDEVSDESAWPEVLSTKLNGRVDNFGVCGYGSDQATLRFMNNVEDKAPVVVLVHLAENIVRNINQYRDLLYRGSGCAFKPRFILGANHQLELVPLPSLSLESYHNFTESPERYLAHESFAPDLPDGPIRARFPYTWSLLRSLQHPFVVAKLTNRPWHARFYDRNHQAQGVQITAEIMRKFHETAVNRGQQPILAIMPTGPDLLQKKRTGRCVYQSLLDEMESRNIPVLDLGPRLEKKMGNTPIINFYSTTIHSHPNAEGYRLVAEVMHEYLIDNALLHEIKTSPTRDSIDLAVAPGRRRL